MEKDIMSASHLWAVLGKKNIQFAWLQKKCMFFFSAANFFFGSCALFLSLKIVSGFRCVFRAKRL